MALDFQPELGTGPGQEHQLVQNGAVRPAKDGAIRCEFDTVGTGNPIECLLAGVYLGRTRGFEVDTGDLRYARLGFGELVVHGEPVGDPGHVLLEVGDQAARRLAADAEAVPANGEFAMLEPRKERQSRYRPLLPIASGSDVGLVVSTAGSACCAFEGPTGGFRSDLALKGDAAAFGAGDPVWRAQTLRRSP